MEESWIQGLDPRIGCPSVAPDPAAIPRTFQRENPAFPLDFLPGWTPHSQDKLPYSVSWDIPGPGMVLRASQISLCHLPAIPINLRKAGLGFILGSSCCSQNIPRLHLVQVPRFPRKKRARTGSFSQIPPAGLGSGISKSLGKAHFPWLCPGSL